MCTKKNPDTFRRHAHFEVGDVIYKSGIICTATDKAHAEIFSDYPRPFNPHNISICRGGSLIIKYWPIYRLIAAGPTTIAQMNRQTPTILREDVSTIIGKGGKSTEVANSLAVDASI
ncbi:MAG: fumarate hydratase C-terminal domain-containing protein [Halobacteriota archaeon]